MTGNQALNYFHPNRSESFSRFGYFEVDPIKVLVWSAIVNGDIFVPLMAALMGI